VNIVGVFLSEDGTRCVGVMVNGRKHRDEKKACQS
jgi:hypothetical protein